jgi:ketosteroid isomerase-like protein
VVLVVGLATPTIFLAEQATGKSEESGSDEAKAAVANLEDVWLNALNNADVRAIAEVLADDFIRPAPDSGHFVTKADILRYYRSHLSRQGSDQRRIEDLTVTVYGSTALARGALTTTNSKGEVTRKLLFTDVFLKRDGKWQAVSAQENPVTGHLAP